MKMSSCLYCIFILSIQLNISFSKNLDNLFLAEQFETDSIVLQLQNEDIIDDKENQIMWFIQVS